MTTLAGLPDGNSWRDEQEPVFDEESYDSEAAYTDGWLQGYRQGYATGREAEYHHGLSRTPAYTHRNGETAPPEEEGWYWVEMQPDLMMPMLLWYMREWREGDWSDPFTYPVSIYGPIQPPKQGENP